MKFISTSVALMLVGLALAACNKSGEEQVSAAESNSSDVENTSEVRRKLPECAKRNKDGTYKYGHACTKEQWLEWEKNQ